MSNLKDTLKTASLYQQPAAPVWKGPEVDGITQSLLSRFLVCRERFRVHVVDGLCPVETFNPRMEFGNMWHVCEEAWANREKGDEEPRNAWSYFCDPLQEYAKSLCQKYPLQQGDVDNWYGVCKTIFPIYVDYWSKHPDVVNRTPLLSEQVFDVPYRLPSGRTVRLRGKWDSVDLVGPTSPRSKGATAGQGTGVWLMENKTKSDIDERQLVRQLSFDLQTMLYLVALFECEKNGTHLEDVKAPIRGVRYNVIRRPRQYRSKVAGKESQEQFLSRLSDIIGESPGEFFMRWNVTITPADVTAFRIRCLDPILGQLCDWWDWVSTCERLDLSPLQDIDVKGTGNPKPNSLHWQHPFGCRNILDEGGASDLDEYLATGSTVGLARVTEMFPELT